MTRHGRIDYHAMRMLRFRRALRAFFRRWGLYLLVAAALFGAGSNAPLTVVAGTAGLLLWPLRIATDHGWVVPATLAYALVGALPVVLTRPLWWPRHWAEAERALPLPPRAIRRSDRLFAMLVMLPWQALLAAGWIGIVAWDGVHPGLALGGWLGAAIGSLGLSSRWMRSVRRSPPRATGRAPALRSGRRRDHRARRRHARWALVVLPLLRGRAPTTTGSWVVSLIANIVTATLAAWTRVSIGWTLAMLAVVALAATSLLRARTTRDLRPLWHDARHLPLDVRACDRARRVLVLAPAFVGLATCLVAIAGSASSVRPVVLAWYACAVAVGCGIETGDTEHMDVTQHGARWMLLLTVAIAFGSEVSPA